MSLSILNSVASALNHLEDIKAQSAQSAEKDLISTPPPELANSVAVHPLDTVSISTTAQAASARLQDPLNRISSQ